MTCAKLVFGSFLIACAVACAPGGGSPDASDSADANELADASETVDAGPTCTDHCRVDEDNEAQCACLFNDECGDGFTCGGVSGKCECGTRGAKAYGESCETGDDCASGLCSDNYCSKRCTENTDCPAPFQRCFSSLGACALNN